MNINYEAIAKLNAMNKITGTDISKSYSEFVLLLPQHSEIIYTNDDSIYIKFKDTGEYVSQKELIEIVDIINPLDVIYKSTKILAPRKYAESLHPIPNHISTQCILLSKVLAEDVENLNQLIMQTKYQKYEFDDMWLKCNVSPSIQPNDLLIIMNRRTGGWDGSLDHPVVELLAGGGHIPCVWNGQRKDFQSLQPRKNIEKELLEELHYVINIRLMNCLGGFFNNATSELVIMYGAFVDSKDIFSLQSGSFNNIAENVNGIYLGKFNDVMDYYKKNARYFAGGNTAKPFNFPMQPGLMNKICDMVVNGSSDGRKI